MRSFKQKLHVLAVGAVFVGAAMLPAAAHAQAASWQYNNSAAVAADAPAYVPPGGFGAAGQMGLLSPVMNSITLTLESIIVWHGVPFAPGSTFSDFVIGRVNDYRFNNAPVTEASYGNGIAGLITGDHQITSVIKATGIQTGPNSYVITPGAFSLDWFWDSGAPANYTFYNFDGSAKAVDGVVVEKSTFVSGNGSNTTSGLPDGSVGLIVKMVDNLGSPTSGPPDFELMTGNFALSFVQGIFAGNNALCADQGGTRTCGTTATGAATGNDLVAFFAADIAASGPVTAIIHTQSEASFIKLVPEPGTLLLLGIGLAGLGFGASRQKKVAA